MKDKNNRRNFLKAFFSTGAAVGLTGSVNTLTPSKNEKVKMLTADGKLVEVDKSVIEKKAGSKKASDKEVYDWMDSKHKT